MRPASEGIRELMKQSAGPKVKATVVVDQIYAQNQHESLHFKHPRGGRAKYLEAPMFENIPKWLGMLSQRILQEGYRTDRGWAGIGAALQREVGTNAPWEFGDLAESAGLMVTVGASVVLRKPPAQKRLSDQELLAKDYMRSLGLGYR